MLFNTVHFALFFVLVLALFFATPPRFRHAVLLAASYYFYMCWRVKYVAVIIAITLIDYFAARQIERTTSPLRRKLFLIASLISNLGLLVAFKYTDFFLGTFQTAAAALGLTFDVPLLHWLLPVGISFHTFQAISYTVEVYRRTVPAETSLLRYALYVAFFPQMVAGPIERPGNLLPQFRHVQHISFESVRSGSQKILWGAFKKVVIADTLATFVNRAYENPHSYSGPILLIATVFFAFQIYCDFSGYSEMAVGIAEVMGFRLMINFRQPYLSQSIAEFWRRWHISLSSWFRDYVYIPLGGNRTSQGRAVFNVVVVFLLSGLWHGANWTFVVWGGLHGLYIVLGKVATPFRKACIRVCGLDPHSTWLSVTRSLWTFTLVLVAWVFFRAKSTGDAFYIISTVNQKWSLRMPDLFAMGLTRFQFTTALVMVVILITVEYLMSKPQVAAPIWCRPAFRLTAYASCFYAIVCFGVFEGLDFIYFQF